MESRLAAEPLLLLPSSERFLGKENQPALRRLQAMARNFHEEQDAVSAAQVLLKL